MKKKLLFAVLLSVATMLSVSAQKFKPAPDFLKGQSEINLVFDFSNTTFDGDSQKEQYKDKGKSWVEEWEGKRRTEFISSFIGSANDELKKLDVYVGEYPKVAYTLIVDVVDCDFGAYAGPMSVPAKLKCTIRVVKTGSTETLATITIKKAQNPYSAVATPIDFDRMYLAFGEMGEEVGEILVKRLK
jgi:hypothetical protein